MESDDRSDRPCLFARQARTGPSTWEATSPTPVARSGISGRLLDHHRQPLRMVEPDQWRGGRAGRGSCCGRALQRAAVHDCRMADPQPPGGHLHHDRRGDELRRQPEQHRERLRARHDEQHPVRRGHVHDRQRRHDPQPAGRSFRLDGRPTSWDANASSTVHSLALDSTNGLLYAGGDFTTVNGATTRNRLAAFSTATAIATSWNANANNIVYALTLDSANSALYAAGTFTTMNGSTTRNRLAALLTASGTATAWNPNVGATNVFALAVDTGAGTAYIGGDFPTVGGSDREAVATVSGGPAGTASVGSVSITAANDLGAVYAARDGNTLYIGGTFTYVAGQARNRLAAIDLTSNTVTSWNPEPEQHRACDRARFDERTHLRGR